MSNLKRRDLLKIGAAGVATLGFPAIVRAQAKEIVILGLWDQTGAFADVGPLNDRGMRDQRPVVEDHRVHAAEEVLPVDFGELPGKRLDHHAFGVGPRLWV